jgi:hypothetical protein
MGRLTLILLALSLTSCSVRQLTEKRTKRNVDIISSITSDILRLDAGKFLVDTLTEKTLRKNLKKLNAESVKIFKGNHHELGVDSLIIVSRHNFMLTFGEIIIDFKKKERELTTIGELKKIKNRIYFRKKILAIS